MLIGRDEISVSTMVALSVIIVSFNTCKMTLECLQSAFAATEGIDAEFWVVDNASTDGSVDAIRKEFPSVRIIASDSNLGFGAANNRAMEAAAGELFLLLNSDAFPRQDSIRTLMQTMRRNGRAGAVGPRLLNSDGSLQHSCFRFPSPLHCWRENLWLSALFANSDRFGDYRRWRHDAERLVDSVSGACMMVRREVFEQVGGFDETFFMYSEETDWQRRMRDAGWLIVFTPASEVVHLGGGSGANDAARINRHFFNSLDYYQWKHHGLAGVISMRSAMLVGCLARLLLWLGVIVLRPARRAAAINKAKRHAWLIWRQTTCWRIHTAPQSLSQSKNS